MILPTWDVATKSPQRVVSPRRQHLHDDALNRRYRRWWYLGILSVGCYLQIFFNFFIYQHFWNSNNKDITSNGQQQVFSGWRLALRKGLPQPDNDIQESIQSISRMFDELSSLQRRADRLRQHQDDGLSPHPYHDDGRFFPFTIRDAQRTVPTQVPHGFHVFDFIDVHKYTTYSFEDNDDEERKEEESLQDLDDVPAAPVDISEKAQVSILEPLRSPAPLFHNGFPILYPFNTSLVQNSTMDCQTYSLRCYRSNLLQVVRYLLEGPIFRNYTHFFYMESDHNLCVSLSQIRSLAYRYPQRSLISVGTGGSGWVMSRTFLRDFYELYRNEDIPSNDWLRPDVVASALLRRHNQPWSVTRRYLTSHTILTSTVFGVADPSLTDHFEYDIDPATVNVTNVIAESNNTTNATTTKEASSTAKEVKMLPPMVPKVHLPRCLEPRRGLVQHEKVQEENDQDDDNNNVAKMDLDGSSVVASWDFFDYTKCPDSAIYPCQE
ncbi:hypothetical protein IV203_029260 [Nitzschia inconspicua]|uniref:Uncharacterized protein n=1 Tax=Nitzschia inconspicua TaxID=303405 RepID=A0A9K3LQA3_9STRA|nr:hypothetical protein IV203_029260 [Nitzschia inconspicua]